MKEGDSVFVLNSEEVDVKDSFIVNIAELITALKIYMDDAKTEGSRSHTSVEDWVPTEISAVVESLHKFLDDKNNVRCGRSEVQNEVVDILTALP